MVDILEGLEKKSERVFWTWIQSYGLAREIDYGPMARLTTYDVIVRVIVLLTKFRLATVDRSGYFDMRSLELSPRRNETVLLLHSLGIYLTQSRWKALAFFPPGRKRRGL